MLSIEVNSYRVGLVAAKYVPDVGVSAQNPVIFLYDLTGRFFARLNFRPVGELSGVQVDVADGLPWFHLSYPREDYRFVLDILRHEKPVYLDVVETDPPIASLRTSFEAFGEAESRAVQAADTAKEKAKEEAKKEAKKEAGGA